MKFEFKPNEDTTMLHPTKDSIVLSNSATIEYEIIEKKEMKLCIDNFYFKYADIDELIDLLRTLQIKL